MQQWEEKGKLEEHSLKETPASLHIEMKFIKAYLEC